jgi:hypothetical protein
MPRIPAIIAVTALGLVLMSCNPFAPALEEGDPFGDLFGDPATIEGFFTNFQTAYELRDIALYEGLLDSGFVFVYYDFDASVEREWRFMQDLESTRRLFQSSTLIRLTWNQILSLDFFDDDHTARVVRSFSLLISLDDGDVFRGEGNVIFTLVREAPGRPWRLRRWRDESTL